MAHHVFQRHRLSGKDKGLKFSPKDKVLFATVGTAFLDFDERQLHHHTTCHQVVINLALIISV